MLQPTFKAFPILSFVIASANLTGVHLFTMTIYTYQSFDNHSYISIHSMLLAIMSMSEIK